MSTKKPKKFRNNIIHITISYNYIFTVQMYDIAFSC